MSIVSSLGITTLCDCVSVNLIKFLSNEPEFSHSQCVAFNFLGQSVILIYMLKLREFVMILSAVIFIYSQLSRYSYCLARIQCVFDVTSRIHWSSFIMEIQNPFLFVWLIPFIGHGLQKQQWLRLTKIRSKGAEEKNSFLRYFSVPGPHKFVLKTPFPSSVYIESLGALIQNSKSCGLLGL